MHLFLIFFPLLNTTVLSTCSEFTRLPCNKIGRMVAWIKHLAQSIHYNLYGHYLTLEWVMSIWQRHGNLLALPAGLSDTLILPLSFVLESFQSFGFWLNSVAAASKIRFWNSFDNVVSFTYSGTFLSIHCMYHSLPYIPVFRYHCH